MRASGKRLAFSKGVTIMNVSEFLSKSYTCYHAVENALAILKKAGFAELSSVGKNKAAKGY